MNSVVDLSSVIFKPHVTTSTLARLQDQWKAKSSGSGQTYDDVDLSSNEWCDYDEKAGVSVGLYKFESRFVLHKG